MYNKEFAECRLLGHTWRWVTDRLQLASVEMELQCTRCGRQKWTTYGLTTGRMIKARTKYPEGYVVRGGLARSEVLSILLQQRHRKAS